MPIFYYILVSVMIVLLLVFIFVFLKYIFIAKDVKRVVNFSKTVDKYLKAAAELKASNDRLKALYLRYLLGVERYEKISSEYLAIKNGIDKLNTVEVKELTKEQADETMELVYLETPAGFHIGLDFTYMDQVKDFKILLPTGEVIDTAKLPE